MEKRIQQTRKKRREKHEVRIVQINWLFPPQKQRNMACICKIVYKTRIKRSLKVIYTLQNIVKQRNTPDGNVYGKRNESMPRGSSPVYYK